MLTTGWSAAGERSQDLFSSEARLQNQTTFSKQLQKNDGNRGGSDNNILGPHHVNKFT